MSVKLKSFFFMFNFILFPLFCLMNSREKSQESEKLSEYKLNWNGLKIKQLMKPKFVTVKTIYFRFYKELEIKEIIFKN